MYDDKFATPEEIKYAASLLIDGGDFEPEKVAIIECNKTCDIKACPGSGKTTTLLAKIIILANRMPLDNNQGICVLTHTNVAIDEIKNKLGHKSDILFKYPNHFGTIQSFVDKFLAIPEYLHTWEKRLKSIENEVAYQKLSNKFKFKSFDSKKWIFEHIKDRLPRQFPRGKKIITEFELNFLKNIIIEFNQEEHLYKKSFNETKALSKTKGTTTYNFLEEVRYSLFDEGYLFYHDAYSLGFSYIQKHSQIQKSFSSRFKYTFIDEMQDTDSFQIDIIEKLFDKEKTVVQRFGDPHQAIFNQVKANDAWKLYEDPLTINASKRFGKNIAHILKTVCIEDNSQIKENENIKSLEPRIIVFDDPLQVLPKFCELLISLKIDDKTIWDIALEDEKKEKKKKKIKAVGWVGEPNNEDRKSEKLTVKSYFPNFRKSLKRKEKVSYDSLKTFLRKQEGAKVKDYSDKIINVFLHILSLENKKYEIDNTKRNYTKTSLLHVLKENHEKDYLGLIKLIAKWSREIHCSVFFNNNVLSEIIVYVQNTFKSVFNLNDEKGVINQFLTNDISEDDFTEEEIKSNNIFVWDKNKNISVELGTIHSAKGETHAATLYLETWYQKKHESESIMEQLTGQSYNIDNSVHKKECLKMAYVGMSRPRYLLCMAIHKDRINSHEDDLEKNGWKLEMVYGN